MLEPHCGAARFAFNHMLGVVKANFSQRPYSTDVYGDRNSATSCCLTCPVIHWQFR
jgi:hypothetical protein